MESREKDSTGDSKQQDWGSLFMILKSRGFSHEEILQLSYPQFNAYMDNINDALSFPIVIPYLGNGEKEGTNSTEGTKVNSKEELFSVVASMNNDFL